MDFAQQPGTSARQLSGIGVAVLAHLIIGYALLNGLARQVVDVFKKPLEVSLIEEIKPPPPPPPPPPAKLELPPPQVPVPPPAYVPPPEVRIETPPPPAPVIVATTAVPPPPVEVKAAPPRPAPPPVASVRVVCPSYADILGDLPYPPQAERLGLSGSVVVEFVVKADGAIGEVGVAKSSNAVFDATAVSAVRRFRCAGQGQSVRVRVPIVFQP